MAGRVLGEVRGFIRLPGLTMQLHVYPSLFFLSDFRKNPEYIKVMEDACIIDLARARGENALIVFAFISLAQAPCTCSKIRTARLPQGAGT